MLQLLGTTDKLDLVTSAAITVDVFASYVDYDASGAAPGNKPTAITTATTTDVVLAPGAGKTRRVKLLTVRNKGAALVTCTLRFNNGTAYEIKKFTLAPDDELSYFEGCGWFQLNFVRDAIYRSILVADQAVPVALTAINNGVLDATNLKPGTIFKWVVLMVKTGAGIASQTFDVRFGTNGTTADTLRLGAFGTGTQTAVADQAEVEVKAVVRSVGAAGVAHGYFELGHNLAATGFAPTNSVVLEGTSAGFDMTVANLKATLCTTPGASAAVTIKQCHAERIDP